MIINDPPSFSCPSFPHFSSFFTFPGATDPTFEVLNLTPPLLQALTVASNALASAKEAQPKGWVVGTSLDTPCHWTKKIHGISQKSQNNTVLD
jgi:hypothetical protein